ncbi:hypothetical protein Slin15195_G103700 [Septoria linicola]|uniref:Uncharacterized protein n=1 Tax=Septoria linicola TaxID=215465 RepID=A0A9Q9B4I5_9PEZI|nr:hypothetical protein Slin15195_G103700 [Septoria linicola]
MYANAAPFQPTGHRHSASYSGGPPPAKKAKGNPVITRYPPPPGYRPPIHSAQLSTYGQLPSFGHNYGQPAYSGSQPQTYMNVAAPSYTPHSTLQPDLAPQSTYVAAQNFAPTQWPPSGSATNHARHQSVPAIPTIILDGNGDPLPPCAVNESYSETLEHSFDEECCYARYPELIEPSLSLGTVVWKAPTAAETALPSTFEARLEAVAPLGFAGLKGKGVSAICNGEEALLSVRQTEAWLELKDSLIFKEFPKVCKKLISLSELLADYRSRFDSQWAAGPRSPTPGLTREPTPARSDSRASNHSQRVELDQQEGAIRQSTERGPAFGGQLNVLDDLEAALRSGSRPPSVSHYRAGSVTHSRAGSITHSRAGSVTHSRPGSVHGHHRRHSSTTNFTRPKPLPVVRDSAQEDILAALGVTGSPQMVYQTPGPAFGPAPTSTNGSRGRHSRESSVASSRSSHHTQQPAILEEPDAVDAVIDRLTRGHATATLHPIEDDREPDDNATPKPQRWQRDNMRKRSYADSQAGAQQEDDETPKRPRASRPEYNAR